MRAITESAGANLGAITYHFGSKRALYERVLDEVVSPLGARVSAATDPEGTPLDRVASAVHAFFDHLAANPDMPQLVLQEIAAGKPPPPPVARLLGSVIQVLARVVADGQEEGVIRSGDPQLMALSIIAQPIHLTLVSRFAQQIIGLDQQDAATRERVVRHTVEFVAAGLAEGAFSSGLLTERRTEASQ